MSDRKLEFWTNIRLRDLFQERKERGCNGLPVASVSIESGLVLRSTLERRVETALTHEEHALVRENDIVYNMMRMWQGACGLAKSDCLVSPAYVVMTPSSAISPQFALEMLRSPEVVKLLHAYSQGIVDDRLRLYPDAFGQIPINLPPLDEQRRIADVLNSIGEAVSTAKAVLEQAVAVKQRIIDDLCYSSEDIPLEQEALPENWQIVQLGDVLTGLRYGTSAKCDAHSYDGLPVLRIPNVVRGRIDFDDLKFASVSDADARRFELQDGDIVLVRTNGNPAHIGRSALVAGVSSPLLFASYLIRLRCDHDVVSAAFIQAVFNSTRVRSDLLRAATTSAGNYNINMDSLRALTIPLPPLPEQRRIADTIAATSAACDAHGHDFWQKRCMREKLASELLSGRVRVPA